MPGAPIVLKIGYLAHLLFLDILLLTANPFPVMTTGISLCSNSHREIPVMNTGSLLTKSKGHKSNGVALGTSG